MQTRLEKKVERLERETQEAKAKLDLQRKDGLLSLGTLFFASLQDLSEGELQLWKKRADKLETRMKKKVFAVLFPQDQPKQTGNNTQQQKTHENGITQDQGEAEKTP